MPRLQSSKPLVNLNTNPYAFLDKPLGSRPVEEKPEDRWPLFFTKSLGSSSEPRQEQSYANLSPELRKLRMRVDEVCRDIEASSPSVNPNSNVRSSRTSSDLSRPGSRYSYSSMKSNSVTPATAFIDFLRKQDEPTTDSNKRNREKTALNSNLMEGRRRRSLSRTTSSTNQPSLELPQPGLKGYSSFPPSLGELPHKVRIACLEQDLAGEKIERQRLESQLSKAQQDLQLEKAKAFEIERVSRLQLEKQAEIQKRSLAVARREVTCLKGVIEKDRERTAQADQRNVETQALVKSLDNELLRLKEALAVKEHAVCELKSTHQSLRKEMDRMIAKNRLLTKQLGSESTLRQEEMSNHEDVSRAMRRRLEAGSKELAKEKERTLEKSRTIEELNERYEKLNARYLEHVKRRPTALDIEVQKLEKALSHSEQKAKHMMNQYTEQLTHIQQKEEELSKTRVELSRLKNKLAVSKSDLLRYRQGDDARTRVEEISRKEVIRLRTELEAEKTRREIEKKKAKEKATKQKDAERISMKEYREAEHALHMKLVETEKNVEFYRAQSIIHENNAQRLQQDITLLHKGVTSEKDDLKSRNRKLEDKTRKLEGDLASQLQESAEVEKRMMQLQVFEQRCKELEKMVESRDRQLSTQALRLIKMNELGITSATVREDNLSQKESEIDADPDEEQEEAEDQEAAARAAVNEPCEKGHVTEKEVEYLKEVQKNLDVIAELIFCCVSGKTPKSGLLDACEGLTDSVNSEELLTEENCRNFRDSVKNLRLDVRHLRSYITKKYASELTEQCYVQ